MSIIGASETARRRKTSQNDYFDECIIELMIEKRLAP
jgi:hypothetical protein